MLAHRTSPAAVCRINAISSGRSWRVTVSLFVAIGWADAAARSRRGDLRRPAVVLPGRELRPGPPPGRELPEPDDDPSTSVATMAVMAAVVSQSQSRGDMRLGESYGVGLQTNPAGATWLRSRRHRSALLCVPNIPNAMNRSSCGVT